MFSNEKWNVLNPDETMSMVLLIYIEQTTGNSLFNNLSSNRRKNKPDQYKDSTTDEDQDNNQFSDCE